MVKNDSECKPDYTCQTLFLSEGEMGSSDLILYV